MFTPLISESDEPEFAPYLICIPIFACLTDRFLTDVSLPLSIDIADATPLPSTIPPERE